eukprot:3377071-Rhodomonas_salina.1
MLAERGIGEALSESVCHVLGHSYLLELEDAVTNHVAEPVESSVNVMTAVSVHWVFQHEDTHSVLLPYLCLCRLSKVEIQKKVSEVDYLNTALTCSHEFGFCRAESDARLAL